MNSFEIFYLLLMGVISLYGAHRYWLVWGALRAGTREQESSMSSDARPRVLIQLPIYNEGPVVARLINSAARLSWPREALEIQVLDDSDDGSTALVDEVVEGWQQQGVPVRVIRRTVRTGYKAGALQEGLEQSSAELVAIFDADFAIPEDFLLRTTGYFGDSQVGMVQARWGFLNENQNLLTRVQALMLHGHFHVEHRARAAAGRFFNFNGTAGIWRRAAILDSGGWQADTVTEDLDLSLRAWLRGWQFRYVDDLEVPSELPADMASYKIQQNRWVSGSMQTAVRLMGRVMRGPLSVTQKIDLFFYLTSNFTYLLLLLLALAVPQAVLIRFEASGRLLWADLPFFFMATVSVFVFCARARRPHLPRLRFYLLQVPGLMALGLGMAVHNARAVLRGLFGKSRVFERTPKVGAQPHLVVATRRRDLLVLLEGGMGLYVLTYVLISLVAGSPFSVPFLSLFGFGYLYVFYHSRRALFG
ncbi:MAG: glycosyltransferase [Planctomycetota bacterium]